MLGGHLVPLPLPLPVPVVALVPFSLAGVLVFWGGLGAILAEGCGGSFFGMKMPSICVYT